MNILNLLRSRDEVSVQAYIPTKSGKLIMSVVGGEGLEYWIDLTSSLENIEK